MALGAMEIMCFFYVNFQILFQTADISLLLSNIVPRVCLLVISQRESAYLAQENIKSEILIQMQFFYWRCSIRKRGVHLSKQKVTLRIEEGEVELLKRKFRTDNQSEAIRLAIIQSLATEDLEKVKTYIVWASKWKV